MTGCRRRGRLSAALVCGFIIAGAITAANADEPVDLALVLASDVSGSVDGHEFRLQREGYAAALQSRRVLEAISSGPRGAIAVSFLEWSSSNLQNVVIGWTVLRGDGEGAMIVANALRSAPRSFSSSTAIGAAIDFSVRQFAQYGADADRRAIDVSGDGTSNEGRTPAEARDDAVREGITINGLAILNPMTDEHTKPPGGLPAYYRQQVVGGPGAFLVVVRDFDSFADAVVKKLLREIACSEDQDAADVTQAASAVCAEIADL